MTAQAPLIIAGNGVVRSKASAALIRFAEAFHLPVVTTFMAKGTIPADHPLALGVIGLPRRDAVFQRIEAADVVVAVGYDLVEVAPTQWNPARDKQDYAPGLLPCRCRCCIHSGRRGHRRSERVVIGAHGQSCRHPNH